MKYNHYFQLASTHADNKATSHWWLVVTIKIGAKLHFSARLGSAAE